MSCIDPFVGTHFGGRSRRLVRSVMESRLLGSNAIGDINAPFPGNGVTGNNQTEGTPLTQRFVHSFLFVISHFCLPFRLLSSSRLFCLSSRSEAEGSAVALASSPLSNQASLSLYAARRPWKIVTLRPGEDQPRGSYRIKASHLSARCDVRKIRRHVWKDNYL